MPELDPGLTRDLIPAQNAPDASGRVSLSSDASIDHVLGQSFGTLYAQPEIAKATYRDLTAFAGSRTATDLLVHGGATGAARLGPLNEALTPEQRAQVPAMLGRALDGFTPSVPGAVSQIIPGASVLRDVRGVPIVAQAREPTQASLQSQAVEIGHVQWVAGFGMEGRAQYGYLSGSAVVGIVFDEDSFGTFMTGSAGFGVGAGSVAGPTGFAIAGPDEITGVAGFGVQFGGFVAAGVAKDFGLTVPVAGDGSLAGGGVTFPLGPAVGVGAGVYSELGYTRVDHLFELSDLQSRGGAVVQDLSGAPRLAINAMMTGLGIRSYDEMARHLISTQASIARQMDRLGASR